MNKRVVVWSDFPYVARTVSASLSEDYEVAGVSFDEGSVQNVAELQPDVIVFDVPSDGRDVAALCDELLQNDVTGGVQILLVEGAFDCESRSELPGFGPDAKLLKPFTADGLRERVESLIRAPPQPRKPIPASAPEKHVAPGSIAIPDDELDEALSEALKELKGESGVPGPDDLQLGLDALEVEPEEIDEPSLDEGVGREESAELLEKATISKIETSADEDKHWEAETVTEQTETGGKGTMGDRELLDEMIDGLVDVAMERVSVELKASLKRSLDEKLQQMAKRAVQELLPKLSERLIGEMFRSESEKQ